MAKTNAKPWHQVVQLRDDITNQELSQKQFAADLYDVVMGVNPGVYHDTHEFFALTYPTVKLRDLARDVMLFAVGIIAMALIVKHWANLQRLMAGTEPKIGGKKKA